MRPPRGRLHRRYSPVEPPPISDPRCSSVTKGDESPPGPYPGETGSSSAACRTSCFMRRGVAPNNSTFANRSSRAPTSHWKEMLQKITDEGGPPIHTQYFFSIGTKTLNLIAKGANGHFLFHAPTSSWNVVLQPGTTTLDVPPGTTTLKQIIRVIVACLQPDTVAARGVQGIATKSGAHLRAESTARRPCTSAIRRWHHCSPDAREERNR